MLRLSVKELGHMNPFVDPVVNGMRLKAATFQSVWIGEKIHTLMGRKEADDKLFMIVFGEETEYVEESFEAHFDAPVVHVEWAEDPSANENNPWIEVDYA